MKEMADVAAIFFGHITLQGRAEEAGLQVLHTERVIVNERFIQLRLDGLYQTEVNFSQSILLDPVADKRMHKRQVKTALYQALKESTGMQPPWGSLTGIRPTRLVYEAMAQGEKLEAALLTLQKNFDVTPQKAELLGQVIRSQESLPKALEQEIDVYIGIPFCESRCRYCSFISAEVGKGDKLAPYVDALTFEIHAINRLIAARGLKVRAFYMGGGTPTALSAELLDRVLTAAQPILTASRETTVEAGRPDSITRERMLVLKDHQIKRISINPQTMHDESLQLIGRNHTKVQTEHAYALAESLGFDHINMDLIAGLPGETLNMFKKTLDWAKKLSPQSLTVHSLCIKRSSDMHRWQDCLPNAKAAEEMVNMAYEAALLMGMQPYYLYRQKHMAGNLENVGYALPGMACLYNVDTMEDTVSVLAMGAGGISKRVTAGREMVYRSPNVKEIDHYIRRVDELIERKIKLFS